MRRTAVFISTLLMVSLQQQAYASSEVVCSIYTYNGYSTTGERNGIEINKRIKELEQQGYSVTVSAPSVAAAAFAGYLMQSVCVTVSYAKNRVGAETPN